MLPACSYHRAFEHTDPYSSTSSLPVPIPGNSKNLPLSFPAISSWHFYLLIRTNCGQVPRSYMQRLQAVLGTQVNIRV